MEAWQRNEAHDLGLILLNGIRESGGGKTGNIKFPE